MGVVLCLASYVSYHVAPQALASLSTNKIWTMLKSQDSTSKSDNIYKKPISQIHGRCSKKCLLYSIDKIIQNQELKEKPY